MVWPQCSLAGMMDAEYHHGQLAASVRFRKKSPSAAGKPGLLGVWIQSITLDAISGFESRHFKQVAQQNRDSVPSAHKM
jgi:hypothetical protein